VEDAHHQRVIGLEDDVVQARVADADRGQEPVGVALALQEARALDEQLSSQGEQADVGDMLDVECTSQRAEESEQRLGQALLRVVLALIGEQRVVVEADALGVGHDLPAG
jgi:hypothetical protein